MFGESSHPLYRPVNARRVMQAAAVAVLVTVLVLSIIYEMDPYGWRTSTDVSVVVVVRQGDTLWTLARTYGRPAADPRCTVSRIREVNKLTESLIRPGQVLFVPQS